MGFTQYGKLKYFGFETFPEDEVTHAIFSRHGGVSPKPWNALNVGGTVGDDIENVKVNIRRSFQVFNLAVNRKYDAWQVHGNKVVFADSPRAQDEPPQKADIILTNKPEVVLFMRFADCVPIMLFDPIKKVVGIAHAGWMGTVKKVPLIAIQAMEEHYGSAPGDILAGIGPSIGPQSYEVGVEVAKEIKETFKHKANEILAVSTNKNKDTIKLNLWEANRILLDNAGVKNIELAGICTATNLNDWYSHRAEHGRTGRFGALITLNT